MSSTSAYSSFWMNSSATTASKLQGNTRTSQTSANTTNGFDSGNTDSSNIFQDFLKTAQQQLDSTKKSTVRKAKAKSKTSKDAAATDNGTVGEEESLPEAQDDTQVAETTAGEDQVVTAGEHEQVDETADTDHETVVDPSLVQVDVVGNKKGEAQKAVSEDPTDKVDSSDQKMTGKPVIYYDRYRDGVSPWGKDEDWKAGKASAERETADSKGVVEGQRVVDQNSAGDVVATTPTETDSSTILQDNEKPKVIVPEALTDTQSGKTQSTAKETQKVAVENSNSDETKDVEGTGTQIADRLEAGREGKSELAVQGRHNKNGKNLDGGGENKGGAQEAGTESKKSTTTNTVASSLAELIEGGAAAKVTSGKEKDVNGKATGASDSQTGLGVLIDHVKTGVSQGAEKAQGAQDTPVIDRDQVLEQVVLGLKGKIDAKNNQAEISLNPPNLGTLKVKIEMTDGNLSAQFISSHPVVRDLLTEHMDTLRSTLESQGITVDRLAVPTQAVTPTETSGGSQTWQNAGGDGRSAGHQEYTGRQNPEGQTGSEGQSGGDKRSQGGFTPLWQSEAEAKPVDLVA